jgi:hypothetical protein
VTTERIFLANLVSPPWHQPPGAAGLGQRKHLKTISSGNGWRRAAHLRRIIPCERERRKGNGRLGQSWVLHEELSEVINERVKKL